MVKVSLLFIISLLRDELNHGPPSLPKLKHHWSYEGEDGPDNWGHHFEKCSGTAQSPVNISLQETEYDHSFGDFVFHNFDLYSQLTGNTILNITNNGHTASAAVKGEQYVEGGGLPGHYKTAEFHFHWGTSETEGSEHSLNGHKFPLEMHIVNYREKYGNISNAMKHQDGLAVLGIFFELSEKDNPDFEPIASALGKVKNDGQNAVISNFQIRALLPRDHLKFYRYQGSLTTPPCYESVIWTVFAEPQSISFRQLQMLRSLVMSEHDTDHNVIVNSTVNSKPIGNNFRPIQPINGRKVFRSFPLGGETSSRGQQSNPLSSLNAGKSSKPLPGTNVEGGDTTAASSNSGTAGSKTSGGSDKQTNVNEPNKTSHPVPDQNPQKLDNTGLGLGALTGGNLKHSEALLSRINSAKKGGTLLSGANTLLSGSTNNHNAASSDVKAQAQKTLHTVQEQLSDIKLPSADTTGIITDPKMNTSNSSKSASSTDAIGHKTILDQGVSEQSLSSSAADIKSQTPVSHDPSTIDPSTVSVPPGSTRGGVDSASTAGSATASNTETIVDGAPLKVASVSGTSGQPPSVSSSTSSSSSSSSSFRGSSNPESNDSLSPDATVSTLSKQSSSTSSSSPSDTSSGNTLGGSAGSAVSSSQVDGTASTTSSNIHSIGATGHTGRKQDSVGTTFLYSGRDKTFAVPRTQTSRPGTITSGALRKPTQLSDQVTGEKREIQSLPKTTPRLILQWPKIIRTTLVPFMKTPTRTVHSFGRPAYVLTPRRPHHPSHRKQILNTTPSMPFVYLQPFRQPVRISRPFFYSYYSERNNPAQSYGSPGLSSLDLATLGELKKRKKRGQNLRTKHKHIINCKH